MRKAIIVLLAALSIGIMGCAEKPAMSIDQGVSNYQEVDLFPEGRFEGTWVMSDALNNSPNMLIQVDGQTVSLSVDGESGSASYFTMEDRGYTYLISEIEEDYYMMLVLISDNMMGITWGESDSDAYYSYPITISGITFDLEFEVNGSVWMRKDSATFDIDFPIPEWIQNGDEYCYYPNERILHVNKGDWISSYYIDSLFNARYMEGITIMTAEDLTQEEMSSGVLFIITDDH